MHGFCGHQSGSNRGLCGHGFDNTQRLVLERVECRLRCSHMHMYETQVGAQHVWGDPRQCSERVESVPSKKSSDT